MPAPETLSLIEILRCRRVLAAAEVAALLSDFPAILQTLTEPPLSLLRAVRVVFPPGTAAAMMAATPVGSWPPFRLLLDDDEPDGSTVQFVPLPSADAPTQLAALLYELLGGRRRERMDAASFSPLAGLNEAGNAVLRRALGGAFGDCQALWQAWLETVEIAPSPALFEWCVPPPLGEGAEPATVLELLPQDAAHSAIWLVARTPFRIGRARWQADWPTRGSHEDDAPPGVSRVHLTGHWLPDGPAFRDGDDEIPSTNGTTFNGAPLAAGELHPLGAGGLLTLGGAYRLEAWRVADAGFRGLVKTGPAADPTPGGEPRRGAVFFRAVDGGPALRDAVWLGSEIAFRLDRAGSLKWVRSRSGGDVAWFLHRHGHFWLANGGLVDVPVSLAGVALDAGKAAPLAAGQELAIGPLRFTIGKVE